MLLSSVWGSKAFKLPQVMGPQVIQEFRYGLTLLVFLTTSDLNKFASQILSQKISRKLFVPRCDIFMHSENVPSWNFQQLE